MATKYIQRVVKFTPEQLAFLEALAVQTNSRAKDGKFIYRHSWQELLRRLGNNEFEALIERNPDPHIARIDAAIAANEQQQREREQERQAEHRRRIAEQTKAARKTPALKLEQLQMELEPA